MLVYQGFLRVSLQLHKWGRIAGARIEAPRRWGVGGGVPLPTGGGGCAPSPEIFFFDSGSQYGEFWCILFFWMVFLYSPATCFTRKTGVIWCPSPFFRFKKDLVHFLAFWRRQKFHDAGPVLVRPSECNYITLRPNSAKASPLQYSA